MSTEQNIKLGLQVDIADSQQRIEHLVSTIKELKQAMANSSNKDFVLFRDSKMSFESASQYLKSCEKEYRGLIDVTKRLGIQRKKLQETYQESIFDKDNKQIKEQIELLRENVRHTEKYAKEMNRLKNPTDNPTVRDLQSGDSMSLSQLRKIAKDNYEKNYGKNQEEYLKVQRQISISAQSQYKMENEINHALRERVTTMSLYNNMMREVQDRMGWIVTKWLAEKAITFAKNSVDTYAKAEKDMAGFAQVMDHSNHSVEEFMENPENGNVDAFLKRTQHATTGVNLLGKPLDEVSIESLYEKFDMSHEPTEQFVEDIHKAQEGFQKLAIKYGETAHDIVESAKLWGRAYKDNATVMALTESATKLAVADAFDIVTANRALESAIMQWGFTIESANDALTASNKIIDSWTALSHNYNVSANTMVEANRRMAQSAKEVGVSFDVAQALIAVMARKTMAEGGEIGNALKSIFGSIHNKNAIKSLEAFGVEVYKIGNDGQKEFRKVDDVLVDLMVHAEGTNQNLEGLLKNISGGKWQWNKMGSALDLSEFLTAYQVSVSAYGFTDAQVGLQLDTVEKKLLSVAESFKAMQSNAHPLASIFKEVLESIISLLDFLSRINKGVLYLGVGFATFNTATRIAMKSVRSSGTEGAYGLGLVVNKLKEMKVASMQASSGLGVVKGAMAGMKASVSTLGLSFGGVVNTIMFVSFILSAFMDKYKKENDEIANNLKASNKHYQALHEQHERMKVATPTIELMANTYDKLRQKLSGLEVDSEQYKKTLDQMGQAESTLASIVGEEGASRIMTSENIQQAIENEMNAHTEKTKEVEKALKIEQENIRNSARTLLEASRKKIKALQDERENWSKITWEMLNYMSVLDALNHMSDTFFRNLYANRRDSRKGDLEKLNTEISSGNLDEDEMEMALKRKENLEKEIKLYETNAQSRQDNLDARVKELIAKAQVESNEYFKMINGEGKSTMPLDNFKSGLEDVGSGNKKSRKTQKQDLTPHQEAYVKLVSGGLTPDEALAFVGELHRESYMNPTQREHGGVGYGLIQVTDDARVQKFNDFFNNTGLDRNSIDGQIQYILWELKNSERQAFDKLRSASTDEERHYNLRKYYFRPADSSNIVGDQYSADFANGAWGGIPDMESAMDKYTKSLEKILGLISKGADLSISAINSKFDNTIKQIEATEKIDGKTAETEAKRTLAMKDKLEALNGLSNNFAKNLEDSKKHISEADEKLFEEVTKIKLEDFYKKSSVEQEKIMLDLESNGNELLLTKLEFYKKLTELSEKHTDSIREANVALKEQRLAEIDYKANEIVDKNKWDVEKYDLTHNYEAGSLYRQTQLQDKLDGISEARYLQLQQAIEAGASPEKIRQLEKQWLEAKKSAEEYANTLQNDVKKKSADLFADILLEGKSFKDLWKQLWKDLARDAINLLVNGVGNKPNSLFGHLLGLFGGRGSGKASGGSLFNPKASIAQSRAGIFGFATGGMIDKEQLVRVGEENKREYIIPTERNDNRAKSLWVQAGMEMGLIGKSKGISPNFKNKSIATHGVQNEKQNAQLAYMAKMDTMNRSMANILNVIANNTEGGNMSMAQPVILKQTMTTTEFVGQMQKAQRLGMMGRK